jgi:hypothetical protein
MKIRSAGAKQLYAEGKTDTQDASNYSFLEILRKHLRIAMQWLNTADTFLRSVDRASRYILCK